MKKKTRPIIAVFNDGTQITIPNPKGDDRLWLFKNWCKRNDVLPFAVLY
jgi:hypothetical protein